MDRNKRALIFAHYDRDGIVDPHVLYSLKAWRQEVDRLIFVSTASLKESDLGCLSRHVDQCIVRENVGYDFASWRCGCFALEDFDVYDEIFFVNDSMYGPLFPIDQLLNRSAKIEADLWGLAISHEIARHVQSYFLVFRRRLISNGFLEDFWSQVKSLNNKEAIIRSYEVGLSQRVLCQGHRIGAVYENTDVTLWRKLNLFYPNFSAVDLARTARLFQRLRRAQVFNPNHIPWREAIDAGVPFVKVELMRDNPLELNVDRICDYVHQKTSYDVNLIKQHIGRMKRNSLGG